LELVRIITDPCAPRLRYIHTALALSSSDPNAIHLL
jgi:hypothetical protein